PARSKKPAEISPLSRTGGLKAARIMTWACSSQIEIKRFQIIWRSTWLMCIDELLFFRATGFLLLDLLAEDRSRRNDSCGHAERNQGRGFLFLDNRGTHDA